MLLSELFDIVGDDLPLLEMANYDAKDTNLDRGYVFISTKYWNYGLEINNHDRYALENSMQPLTDAKEASRKLELVYK
jgi:hypothetical protein